MSIEQYNEERRRIQIEYGRAAVAAERNDSADLCRALARKVVRVPKTEIPKPRQRRKGKR